MRGRLAVGDDEHDRLGVGVLVQEAAGEHQRVLQVRALHVVGFEAGEVRGLRGRAYDEKPMICSASCGNWPLTSECSASAVDLAGPQVSRSTIE